MLNKEEIHTEYHFLNLYGDYIGDPAMNHQCFLYQYYTGGDKNIDMGKRQFFDNKLTEEIIEKQVEHFINKSNIVV